MSDTDSFIEEVTEEVRRDRLFGYVRRYGWIGVVLVVGLVGGAAYNEVTKARAQSQAEARGDAILAALESEGQDRVAALAEVSQEGVPGAVALMLQADAAVQAEDDAAAADALGQLANDAALPQLYRDLAQLKLSMLTADTTAPEDRIAALMPLTRPGGAYRVLAEEQIALAEIQQGKSEAAITRLRALLEDNEASSGLRQRATQLIVALGGELEPA